MTDANYMAELFEEVFKVLNDIKLETWYRKSSWDVELNTDVPTTEWAKIRFRVRYYEPDVDTGVETPQLGRWWYVEDWFNEQAIVKAAWAALTMSDEHRRREGFTYKSERIFSPHRELPIPRDE